jgi:hypothetical protein
MNPQLSTVMISSFTIKALNDRIVGLMVLDERFQSYPGLVGSLEPAEESSRLQDKAKAHFSFGPEGH